MANEYIIKEWNSNITFSQNMSGNTITINSSSGAGPNAINGELLQVEWKTQSVGSVFITRSGVGEEIFRRNAPSGASWQFAIPRKFGELTTGSVATSQMVTYAINEPLTISIAAGSNVAISGNRYDFRVLYR